MGTFMPGSSPRRCSRLSPALHSAQRQDWPDRPVTLVVPYAAGGPVDTIARIIAARMSEILGQQMVIENVGGAGGLTGAARVAKAAPDGYTVLLSGSAVLAQNPELPASASPTTRSTTSSTSRCFRIPPAC